MSNNIYSIFEKQKNDFNNNGIISINKRICMLKKIKNNIDLFENDFFNALKKDLNKSFIETYITEISEVKKEVNFFIKNLKKLNKPINVRNSFSMLFTSKNKIFYKPYGCVLIIVPFNYPINLSLIPLIGAIAAGNKVIIKGSPLIKNTNNIINDFISKLFDNKDIYFISNNDNIDNLFDIDFDFVFFTGGVKTGKLIVEKFGKKLIPYALELGGKSPVIIDKTANIELLIKRLVWGKLLNAGQTCVAPDYILVNKNIYDNFINSLIKEINKQFNNSELKNNLPNIVDKNNVIRILKLIKNQKILFGGKLIENTNIIEPTVIEINDFNNDLMKEEIFGPIFPLIKYEDNKQIFEIINLNPNPLTTYLFSNDKNLINEFNSNKVKSCSLVVNDVIVHLSKRLPFGGINTSGNCKYRYKYSFELFSYQKSFVYSSWLDTKLRYSPFINDLKKVKRRFK